MNDILWVVQFIKQRIHYYVTSLHSLFFASRKLFHPELFLSCSSANQDCGREYWSSQSHGPQCQCSWKYNLHICIIFSQSSQSNLSLPATPAVPSYWCCCCWRCCCCICCICCWRRSISAVDRVQGQRNMRKPTRKSGENILLNLKLNLEKSHHQNSKHFVVNGSQYLSQSNLVNWFVLQSLNLYTGWDVAGGWWGMILNYLLTATRHGSSVTKKSAKKWEENVFFNSLKSFMKL